ncbi:hypothetical protein FA10DRAFT_288649 [Acaromyces ingoldii]|uniref:Uncharacterized protein n=1 Tax=Acaromyces ingoldii TaxID=215250 RepID=A0A316YIN9_9BASI|nr:hypothetical protein FA10DRAFT_288649 [Acaromyces ingoldii]PWN87953.1 hypothetical protein FA10DRAFT_288649 [Acaromyces ingoldii]
MAKVTIKLEGPPVISSVSCLRGTIEVQDERQDGTSGPQEPQEQLQVELSLTRVRETWQCRRDILSDPFWAVSVDKKRIATVWWPPAQNARQSQKAERSLQIECPGPLSSASETQHNSCPTTFTIDGPTLSNQGALRPIMKSVARVQQVEKLYLKATLVEKRQKTLFPLPFCCRQSSKRLSSSGVSLYSPDLHSHIQSGAGPPAFSSIEGDRVVQIAPPTV